MFNKADHDGIFLLGSSCTLIATFHNSPDTGSITIQSLSAELVHERITVQLEWTVLLSQTYYQQLLQNVTVHVVPDPERANTGNRTLQLTLLYNTLYNVSITQPGICGRPNQTASIELKYLYSTYIIILYSYDVMMM